MTAARRLTALFVKNVSEPGKYYDEHGLLLRVTASKQWIQRLTVHGKRRDIGLGSVTYVTLAKARKTAFENKKLARAGGDPVALRQRKAVPTFAEAAETVIALHEPNWRNSSRSAGQWRASLRDYAYPAIGAKPVSEIGPQDVMGVLLPHWNDKRETMRRVKQRIQAVMRWAVAQGFRTDDPVAAIAAALPKNGATRTNFRALPHGEVAEAIAGVRASQAAITSKLAFEFLVLTAARSGEVRLATWAEIDMATATWTIPAERMKAGKEHRVPLSGRAIAVLHEAAEIADGSGLVFPSVRGRAMSDSTLSKLLREIDVKAVPHGFRSSFRDWAGDNGWPREVAEMALAHVVVGVEEAYARSDLLDRRRELMDAWAGFLRA